MAEDVIGRCHVKKELRHAEGQQQRLAGKLPRHAVTECKDDVFFFGAIDFRSRYVGEELLHRRNARFQFANIGFGFGKDRRIGVGK